MAGFALSCFGLLLFLWLAFGGPIPLQPKGYRFNVAVPRGRHAVPGGRRADLRRVGGQGQARSTPDKKTGASDATIELDSAYAPIPKDTKAILRQKTLLGETYVELTPGSPSAGTVPENGSLPAGAVSPTVELDEIFRAFDAEDARVVPHLDAAAGRSPRRAAGATSPTRWATSRPSRRTPPRC